MTDPNVELNEPPGDYGKIKNHKKHLIILRLQSCLVCSYLVHPPGWHWSGCHLAWRVGKTHDLRCIATIMLQYSCILPRGMESQHKEAAIPLLGICV